MSLYVGIMSEHLLGGMMGTGGYMFRTVIYKNIGQVPVLLLHGDKDPIIV